MEMNLYFAGIHHGDPFCVVNLRDYLDRIHANITVKPDFIAVEWGQNCFETFVQEQRKIFGGFIRTDPLLKNLSLESIDLLTNLIGYEADTHKDIFPDVNTLWLDNYRNLDDRNLPNIAKNNFTRIKGVAESLSRPISEDYLLTKISESCEWYWDKPSKDEIEEDFLLKLKYGEHDFDRDETWANLIIDEIEKNGFDNFGIIIVGAEHTVFESRYLANLLKKQSFQCDVKLMKYPYTQNKPSNR